MSKPVTLDTEKGRHQWPEPTQQHTQAGLIARLKILAARATELETLLERALPPTRIWAGMVRRSSGHHSEKSAAADQLVSDIRSAIARAQGETL